jgi:hypothetical protein
MSAFQTYLVGLGVAHVAWFYFFTTGHLLGSSVLEELRWFELTDLVITPSRVWRSQALVCYSWDSRIC